jgi:hypothetical protein
MRGARRLLPALFAFALLVPGERAAAQSRPYSLQDVVDLVKGGVPATSILAKTKSSCINFHLTAEAGSRLRAAGATDALVAGLVSTCYKGEPAEITNVNPRPHVAPPKVVVLHDTVKVHDTPVTPVRSVSNVVPPPSPSGITAILPDGTGLNALLGQAISSKDAKNGDRVKMSVAEDLVINGRILITKGTPIIAEVSDAKPAGRFGRGGKLTLRLIGTTAVDDQPVKLRGTKEVAGDDNTGSAVALSLLYGAGFFRHGEDITFKEGYVIPVFVDQQMTITMPRR